MTMTDAKKKPVARNKWLIIGANAYHVTASDTLLMIEDEMQTGESIVMRSSIPAATGSGYYSFFGPAATQVSNSNLFIVEEGEIISFNGDVNAIAFLKILEWTP